MEKEERKQRKLLTENRLTTVNKRETSFEGLISQLENGEDGIYNLIKEDKNSILDPKVKITKKDLEEIPFLSQLREAISVWEEKLKTATGHDAYIIKNAIIELRKDQYIIREAYRKPVMPKIVMQSKHYIPLEDDYYFDDEAYIVPEGISLCNPKVISTILCNYSSFKENSWGEFAKDLWYIMEDFDDLVQKALADYPIYYKICEYKVDGLQNIEIQKLIEEEFAVRHTQEYISNLWRNKIPKIIASKAEDIFLDWYFLNEARGKYKRCSKCGEIKLAHNKYFSKNKTSKDGYYSICKQCRNSK